MENITFKSGIRPANMSEFYNVACNIGEKGFVKYPWTINQSVLRDAAYTTGVIDCTVCGITDGTKVLLTHICPTVEGNMNFKKIEEFIKSKIKYMNKEFLQGLLLGSQGSMLFDSRKLYHQFEELMNKLNIPTTFLRGGFSETHAAYSSVSDEWIIASEDVRALKENLTPTQTVNEMFEYVNISPFDEIV